MNDMNFFSSYNSKRVKKDIEKPVIFIKGLAVLVLIGIIAYGAFNYFSIRKLGKEIIALNTELEAVRKEPRLEGIIAMEKEAALLKEDLSGLYALDKYIDSRDTINELLLEAIRVNTPPELFLDAMLMNQQSIKIEGKSKDKESIAQFEHNLREAEGLEKVFVSQVTDENGYYSFYMDIDLKGEMPGGAETGKQ
ncbi:MAG: PilN domain-containing protein [Gracilibacteraceae bacterium]|nr:PilN domain-containing protein [Gracilibacteraceae bacterium]HQE66627.1 PilN domain-containing protein [Bacillota bacterium]